MTDYSCRACRKRLPGDQFEWITDKNGRRAPRKHCRVCNGELGHKVCAHCGIDKDIKSFPKMKKSNGTTHFDRNCSSCKYRMRRGDKPKQKTGPKPNVLAKLRKHPGWTPPPTREELAALHSRYSPPPGWTPPYWETDEQDDTEGMESECA